MKKTVFTGSGVAIITPMHSDGSVNYEVLKELIEFQIKNGTDAIISCGTTGESATLSHKEHCKVIQFTIDQVAGLSLIHIYSWFKAVFSSLMFSIKVPLTKIRIRFLL